MEFGQTHNFLQILLKRDLISRSGLDRALARQRETEEPIGKVLVDLDLLEESQLYDYICNQLGMNPDGDYSEWTFSIAGLTLPRYKVSGDFFGFFPLDEGVLAITLCDVCGKGVEAGVLAIALAEELRAAIRRGQVIPSGVVRRMNQAAQGFFGPDQFAAFGVLILDVNRGTVDYCCAGTPPVLVYRAEHEEVEDLPVSGLPIGIYPDSVYSNAHTLLRRGDTVLMFSDGAFEAESRGGHFFGIGGLAAALRNNRSGDAAELLKKIRSELRSHTFLRGLNDDTTLVAIRKMPRRMA